MSATRKTLTTLIGSIIAGLLLLIAFVVVTGFPGPPQGSADKTNAPPEDVTRAG